MSSSLLRSLLNQGTSTSSVFPNSNNTNDSKSSSSSSSSSVLSDLFTTVMKGNPVVRCDAPPPPLPPVTPNDATASSNSNSSSSSPPPPPPEEVIDEEDAIAKAAREVSGVKNPGSYEHASSEIKRLVSLDTTDGARFDIQKQLSPFMMVVHSFWLGTSMLPEGKNKTYTFVTQVASDDGMQMYQARIDPEKKSVNGSLHYVPLGSKIQLSISPTGENDQMLAEIDLGSDQSTWTANMKYGSMGGGILLGGNYYQSITSKLAMGGEGMYLSANKALLSNYTLRYTMTPPDEEKEKDSSVFLGQWNPSQQMLSLYYKRTVTPGRVNVGAELSCNPMAPDQSQVAIGAEFQLTRSKVNLCVGGDGRIQSIVETKLGMQPGSPTLNLSANIHHASSDMKFGYGLTIGG